MAGVRNRFDVEVAELSPREICGLSCPDTSRIRDPALPISIKGAVRNLQAPLVSRLHDLTEGVFAILDKLGAGLGRIRRGHPSICLGNHLVGDTIHTDGGNGGA